jgi:hypothetical protein
MGTALVSSGCGALAFPLGTAASIVSATSTLVIDPPHLSPLTNKYSTGCRTPPFPLMSRLPSRLFAKPRDRSARLNVRRGALPAVAVDRSERLMWSRAADILWRYFDIRLCVGFLTFRTYASSPFCPRKRASRAADRAAVASAHPNIAGNPAISTPTISQLP